MGNYRNFKLVTYFVAQATAHVTREELDCALWNSTSSGNCTDVYICYLRKKLEKIAGPGTVLSVRGRGYMMKKINNN